MAKPDRRVQLNVRILESERRQLVEAAHKRRTTLNATLAGLLMGGLQQERLLDAEQIIENTLRGVRPLLENVHELNVSGNYRRAVGKLMALVRPLLANGVIAGQTGEAIRAVLDEIDVAEIVAEKELGRRLRQMHTTGAKS